MKFLPASSEVLALSNSAVVVNEQSSDVDFRVESNSKSHMLFVDGGNNSVGIGTGTVGNSTLEVLSTGVDGTFANAIGFQYIGNSNEANTISTAVSSNAGKSGFKFNVSDGGGSSGKTSVAKFVRNEVSFNDDSNNLDFRVESDDYTHMLCVDAGANSVRVGGAGNDISAHLEVKQSFSKSAISQQSTSVISGTGQPAKMAEGVEAYDTSSLGTILTIPITDQGNLHRQYIVEFMFCSAEYNSHSSAKAGTLKIGFTSLNTGPNALVVLEKTGNVDSVSGNDSNLLITFTSGYTIGLSDYEGVICHYRVLGYSPEYLQMWNGTLN
jgi:hypothetical protein